MIKKNVIVLLGIIMMFFSCKKELKDLGSDIVNGGKFNTGNYSVAVTSSLLDYNNDSLIVTSNSGYLYLGEYNFKNFGTLKSDIVLKVAHPEVAFYGGEVVDSVILNMPYLFSNDTSSNSKFPNDNNAMTFGTGNTADIDIHTINEYIEDTTYFKDINKFTNNINIYQKSGYTFNFDTIFHYKTTTEKDDDGNYKIDTTHETPRLKLKIKTDFWQDLFNNYSNRIINAEEFNDIYKGIKIEFKNITDRLIYFNANSCYIDVFYHNSKNEEKSYRVNVSNKSANIYDFIEGFGTDTDKLYLYGLAEKEIEIGIDENIKKLKDSLWLSK